MTYYIHNQSAGEINRIVWDGVSPFTPQAGWSSPMTEAEAVAAGLGGLINPPPPELTPGQQRRITYDEAIASGYDTGLGFAIALDDESRSQFVALRSQLLSKDYDLPDGSPAESDFRAAPCVIADISGALHLLTNWQVKALLDAAGDHYATLWVALNTPE